MQHASAAVCRGLLKPGPQDEAAIPGVTVNGSVGCLLSCVNRAVRNREGREGLHKSIDGLRQ